MQLLPLPDRRFAQAVLPAARPPLAEGAEVAPADAFGALRRPAALVRAGRAGAALYRRSRHLRGIGAGLAGGRRSARELAVRLAELEADCEAARRAGAPDYTPARHVLVLSALLAERSAALCGA